MKILILTFALLLSAHSFAETKTILCQKIPGNSQGAFSLVVDNTHMQPSSGYFHILRANWGYAYSGTGPMSCTDHIINMNGREQFKCIGYANAQWRMEITVTLDNGTGTAKVSNIDNNIYANRTEGMVLPCRIEER